MKKQNFILRLVKMMINALSKLKIKSKCCNSECVNGDKVQEQSVVVEPQGHVYMDRLAK